MGLHPDFHQIEPTRMHFVLELLSASFQVGSDGPKFFCSGVLGLEGTAGPPITTVDGFTNEVLEILAEKP